MRSREISNYEYFKYVKFATAEEKQCQIPIFYDPYDINICYDLL